MPRPSGTAKLARRLGARVRELRDEAGLTQEKLAWECELSKPYLSQIEAGKRMPSIAVLGAVAKRLGILIADIVALEPNEPRLRLLEAARHHDEAALEVAVREVVSARGKRSRR